MNAELKSKLVVIFGLVQNKEREKKQKESELR